VQKYFRDAHLVKDWVYLNSDLANYFTFSPPDTNKFISKEANEVKNSLSELWQYLDAKQKKDDVVSEDYDVDAEEDEIFEVRVREKDENNSIDK
jgi:hypothetical protein